jgi:hypothetical protein
MQADVANDIDELISAAVIDPKVKRSFGGLLGRSQLQTDLL